ncbi:hypothetical protein TYRP_013467 [Tyrophagus putrescentiae]|nr:hypothetical protein TYRP_013467 [Tyrophagus putrescentiae]
MSPKLENIKSPVLDDGQNERLFSLIGSRCFTLSTAVAQLSPTESDVEQAANQGPANQCSTVVCLIKDFTRRSYFVQTFDLSANELLCEIDLLDVSKYEEIDLLHHVIFERAKTYRLQFENKIESVPFYDKVHEILAKKTRRKPSAENTTKNENTKVIENRYAKISSPFNFVHLQHVGWNDQLSKFMTTYPQSDEAISPYQVVSRKFAACRGDNEETVNTEKQHHQSAMYANEEFAIYNKAEIASIFNTEFLHKFGHFEKICVKSIALPPPPPPPPR